MANRELLQTYLRHNIPPGESASTQDMTPVLMLGLLKKIDQARAALQQHKPMEAGLYMGRATAILDLLRDDLDIESGGQVARDYDRLYGLIDECLQRAVQAEPAHFLNMAEEFSLKLSDWWTFSGEGHWPKAGHA